MRAFALIMVAAVALLSGCTGIPTAPGPGSPPSTQAAPPVASPKDARGIPPCGLLTAAQATALGVDPTRAEAGSTADLVNCTWPSTQPPVSSIFVSVDTNPARRGLTDAYLKRDNLPIFEPLVVEGYPAVRAELGPSNDCTIYVGLSDIEDMFVNAVARSPADTCGLVKRAIGAMLTNLPPQR